jgi:hypothetical protein
MVELSALAEYVSIGHHQPQPVSVLQSDGHLILVPSADALRDCSSDQGWRMHT